MKRHIHVLSTLAVCLLILVIPYYMFRGHMYIGGDDTRLYYHYPFEFLRNIAFSSWNSFSSFGFNNPNQFYVPFLLAWSVLRFIVGNELVLNYLAFSLPLITAFLTMGLLIRALIGEKDGHMSAFAGALIYVLSPITILHQISVFLGIWFFAIAPLIVYFFVRYLRSNAFRYVVYASLTGLVFSVGFIAIPWIAGLILPLCVGCLVFFLLTGSEMRKRLFINTCIYVFFVAATQAFWILPFMMSAFGSQQSFAGTALSSDVAATFASTVGVTASGNVMYPLVNLPQRQLAFDFNWDIKMIFEHFFDRIFLLDAMYVIIFFFGLFEYKKVLRPALRKLYLVLITAYASSLFFLTVNIGPLKYLFLQFGRFPGFSMFRNFYDKFALGYIFLSAIILSLSLYCIARSRRRYAGLAVPVTVLIIFLNAIPIRAIVNAPLWGTDISRETTLPREYTHFLSGVSTIVPPSANVLVLPLNIASYAIIPADDPRHVYVGTSPTKVIDSVNMISGGFSFFGRDSLIIRDFILGRRYDELRGFLAARNIGYVILQKNVPKEVMSSYLFDPEVKAFQDEQLEQNVTGELLLNSSDGNYSLYKTRVSTALFELSGGTVRYTKIHSGRFTVSFDDATESSLLQFRETYHSGWTMYPEQSSAAVTCNERIELKPGVTECRKGISWNMKDELYMLFSAPLAGMLHRENKEFGHEWDVEPGVSEATIYFKPQRYVYIGIFITGLIVALEFIVLKIRR